VKRSLRSWVYVTSSADRKVRAGMYRLLDLPLFREQPCSTLPNQQCSAGVGFKEVANAVPNDLPPAVLEIWKQQNFGTRTITTDDDVRINTASPLIDGIGSAIAWKNGREAVVMYRCSELINKAFSYNPCEFTPYQWDTPRPQCTSGPVLLSSNPSAYGATHWLPRLDPNIASPSPPPPPPNPNPPPAPPSPHPPPSPPRYVPKTYQTPAMHSNLDFMLTQFTIQMILLFFFAEFIHSLRCRLLYAKQRKRFVQGVQNLVQLNTVLIFILHTFTHICCYFDS